MLDKDRQPIEGLFAAGIVSGGMFYNTYPHHSELPLAHPQLPDGLHHRPGAGRQAVAPHPHLFR
ncbi:MAG: hypothetical protein ACLTDR_03695 [Adlercreutzia equolifaciens]